MIVEIEEKIKNLDFRNQSSHLKKSKFQIYLILIRKYLIF